jgi:hypothetical protein
MKRYTAIYVLALLGFVLVAAVALAGSSANYGIPWDVVGRGGDEMASGSYAIRGTTGQAIIGPGASDSYALGAGYWYRFGGVYLGGYGIYLPLVIRG